MIAAFLGQGLGVFDAAKYAVYLHGLAGDLAAKEKTQMGMIASDIIEKIPAAIKKCS
jgi:NAD(P)H-hydrate epimerase